MNQQAGPIPREVSVAVIGAGTMGGGIALVAATAGHSVLLYDAAPGAAEAGCKRQRADVEQLVARGKLTEEDCKDRLSRLHPDVVHFCRDDDAVHGGSALSAAVGARE